MVGNWLRPHAEQRFHFRAVDADAYLCGHLVTRGRKKDNCFTAYADKCEVCLLRYFVAVEKELEEAGVG